MKEVVLPSKAVLKINPAPFSDARALYKALVKELKALQLNNKMEMAAALKDIFCAGFSSDEVEKCLMKCFERCTYNSGNGDLKINVDTFEPVQAREDYVQVCIEVAQENVSPFFKSLYAAFVTGMSMIGNDPK